MTLIAFGGQDLGTGCFLCIAVGVCCVDAGGLVFPWLLLTGVVGRLYHGSVCYACLVVWSHSRVQCRFCVIILFCQMFMH